MITLILLAGVAAIALTSIVWLYDVIEYRFLNTDHLNFGSHVKSFTSQSESISRPYLHPRRVKDLAPTLYSRQHK